MINFGPLGDRAFLARFATGRDALAWSERVRASRLVGVLDVVLAYRGVAVYADPTLVDLDLLEEMLRGIIAEVSDDRTRGRAHRIPVLYEGDDLSEVASRIGRSIDDVIALHSGRVYDVMAVGFLPGFPYAGDLAPQLSGLPRRDCPRPRVPSGSVAIAGRQTGIYPRESPGGWHLLGRTPLTIADPARGRFPIVAGDRIQFVPVDALEFRGRSGEHLE